MIHPRKPVWTEGLFMTPQHLQQSDQYHEALLHSRMHAIATYDWGVTGVNAHSRLRRRGGGNPRRFGRPAGAGAGRDGSGTPSLTIGAR